MHSLGWGGLGVWLVHTFLRRLLPRCARSVTRNRSVVYCVADGAILSAASCSLLIGGSRTRRPGFQDAASRGAPLESSLPVKFFIALMKRAEQAAVLIIWMCPCGRFFKYVKQNLTTKMFFFFGNLFAKKQFSKVATFAFPKLSLACSFNRSGKKCVASNNPFHRNMSHGRRRSCFRRREPTFSSSQRGGISINSRPPPTPPLA